MVRLVEMGLELCQLLVIAWLLQLLMFEGTGVHLAFRLGVIAALLAGVVKSQCWFVLLALQASLFLREPRRPEVFFGVVPMVFCVTVIAIVAYTCLGRPFRIRVSSWIVKWLRDATAMGSSKPEGLAIAERSSSWTWFAVTQLLTWIAVAFVAIVLLGRLPISSAMRSEWLKSSMENESMVWPGAGLLVLAVLLIVVFMEAGWRQMTGAQARLYLRSSLMLYHYRDLRMIVLKRLKLKRAAVSTAAAQKRLSRRDIDAPPRN